MDQSNLVNSCLIQIRLTFVSFENHWITIELVLIDQLTSSGDVNELKLDFPAIGQSTNPVPALITCYSLAKTASLSAVSSRRGYQLIRSAAIFWFHGHWFKFPAIFQPTNPFPPFKKGHLIILKNDHLIPKSFCYHQILVVMDFSFSLIDSHFPPF